MIRKYAVTLEDTLQGWQEDEDELERKYGAELLDCGNCEIVQASISTGIKTASRLVDEMLDKIRAEITKIATSEQIDEHTAFIRTGEQVKQMALDIIDTYKVKSEEENNE